MTNKNKKRRAAPSYRQTPSQPEAAGSQPRRGLLDGIFGGSRAAPMASMPRVRTAVSRGVVTVLSTPVLVVGVPALLWLMWLSVVLGGYQGPFAIFVNAFALPPVGTSFDASLATGIFGLQGGLIGIVVFVVMRAIIMTFLAAWIVDVLERGHVTSGAAIRALRAFPTSLAVNMASIALLTLASLIGPMLGASFAILIQVASLVAGVYLFAAAPVIAVTERRRMPDAMSRSIRAARMPGTGSLVFATLYVIPALALVVAPGKPGSLIGVNPSVGAWALAIVASLLHVAMLAAFAFRYLSIADEVPDAPPPRARTRAAR